MKVIIKILASASLAFLLFGIVNISVGHTGVIDNVSTPLIFTENRGQFGDITRFRCDAGGMIVYFTPSEVAYMLIRETNIPEESPIAALGLAGASAMEAQSKRNKREGMLIRAGFVGANQEVVILGEGKLGYYNNYFLGNDPSKWCTRVPNYSSIVYKNLYQGIDLRYYKTGRSLKYDFIVRPGADPAQIKIKYDGINGLTADAKGNLIISTTFGDVVEKRPYVYIDNEGGKTEVKCSYEIIDGNTIGFKLTDSINRAETLIIDPELVFSTFLGGSDYDSPRDMEIDSEGNIYITGDTHSLDYPLENPFDPYFGGDREVFITKLASSGDFLIYSSFLGGSYYESAGGIGIDAMGNAYLTGYTASYNFPLKNPYDSTIGGGYDAFATIVSPGGDSLLYSTFLGGSNEDVGIDIAADQEGYFYVYGETNSQDFPTFNPFIGTPLGGRDAFITKMPLSGQYLEFSTYFGGSSTDGARAMCLDPAGNIYFAGGTHSSDFPVANAYQGEKSGLDDAFVSKLSSRGDSLIFSTYLGGSASDVIYGIAVDRELDVCVTGQTVSPDFPLENPFDSTFNNIQYGDAFVSKLSSGGNSLVFSTYLGGSRTNAGKAIDADSAGFVYVTGLTSSDDFPVKKPLDGSYNGLSGNDAFITKFIPSGSDVVYSSFLGGCSTDNGYGIRADSEGNIVLCGHTGSYDFPVLNAFDSTYDGADLFVTKIYESEVFQNTSILMKDHYSQEVVPAGGSFDYTGVLINNEEIPKMSEVWIMLDLPSGHRYGPVKRMHVYLDPLERISAPIIQWVPNYAPQGEYRYVALCGDYPSSPEDSALISLFVYTPSTGSNVNDWYLEGWFGNDQDHSNIPTDYRLYQNYPNPFNSSTTITYALPVRDHVKLEIFNILGQRVEILIDRHQTAGVKSITWDASRFASGIYFYKLTAGDNVITERMTLLK
jgi:hypothetical protein